MELFSIDTELFKLDGGAIFGVVPKTIWSRRIEPDENNLINLAMRLLLIKQNDRLILIDTGIGNKQDEKFFGYYYLNDENTLDKSLHKHSFSRDDITDVFLTHLHFDHAGGAIVKENDQLVPAFKNATYWSNPVHWNWAIHPNPREKPSFLKENLLPLQESGRLRFIEVPVEGTASFTDDVTIRFVSGHTEAMMIPQIQYKDKTIIFTADLFISVHHIPLNYVSAYDMKPLATMQEKNDLLNEAVDNGYIFFFEHDAHHECCTLERSPKGIVVKDTFQLQEIL